jgi:hypothetical protein
MNDLAAQRAAYVSRLEAALPPDRLAPLYGLIHVGVDVDLLAWTPAEYEVMRQRAFGRSIAADERIVYEA